MPKVSNELEAFKLLLMAIDKNKQPDITESGYQIKPFDPTKIKDETEEDKESGKTGKLLYYFLESRGKVIFSKKTAKNICTEINPATLLEMLAISRISGYPYKKVVFKLCFRPIVGKDISDELSRESVLELMKKLPHEVVKMLYEKCNGDVHETCRLRPEYFATLIKDSFTMIMDSIEKTYLETFDDTISVEPQSIEENKEQEQGSPVSTPSQEIDQYKDVTKNATHVLDDDDDDFEDYSGPTGDINDSENIKLSVPTEFEYDDPYNKEGRSKSPAAQNAHRATSMAPPRKRARFRESSECLLIKDPNFYPKMVKVYGYSSLDEIINGNVRVKKHKFQINKMSHADLIL